MIETRSVEVCPTCGVHWHRERQPARCLDPAHEHTIVEVHVHRSTVRLPDGTAVAAVSFDPLDPYSRTRDPRFGLYLDPAWHPPWPHGLFSWPDFGVPADPGELERALGRLLARARQGDEVELGCLGGHGRTGTALACLAVLCGQPPSTAVQWAREHYCVRAVETHEQEAFVVTFSGQ